MYGQNHIYQENTTILGCCANANCLLRGPQEGYSRYKKRVFQILCFWTVKNNELLVSASEVMPTDHPLQSLHVCCIWYSKLETFSQSQKSKFDHLPSLDDLLLTSEKIPEWLHFFTSRSEDEVKYLTGNKMEHLQHK